MYLRRRRRDWISRIKQRVIRCRPYASCVSAVRERVQRTSPLQSLRREEALWQRNETENRDAYIVAIGQVMQRLAITKMMLEEHHPRHLLDVAIINFCIPFRSSLRIDRTNPDIAITFDLRSSIRPSRNWLL